MGNPQKLRIVIDNTLKPGQQLAQACHIMREWSAVHPDLDERWYKDSNYLVCLSASPDQLKQLMENCEQQSVPWAYFKEPDYENKITGIALAPCDQARKLTSQFPLALR